MTVTTPEELPQQPAPIAHPPKKRPTGLIVAACIGALVVLAAAATAIVVAAQPSSSNKSPSAANASPSARADLTASPAEPTATVRQYASAVSPPIKSLRKTWTDYDGNACAVKSDPSDLVCGFAPLTFNMQANTLLLTLTGAVKPGVPAYIGKPPAELEKLIADTLVGAQGLMDVTASAPKTDSKQVFFASSRLMTVLDRWDPYL